MGDLKKLKTIGGIVNNILPLVYDESLSYYEVTCKILELINDANIEGMKEDIEYIKNLLEGIDLEELETIINNLFNEDTPNMDGVGSAGVSDSASRSDHVHPSDTSKANKNLDISGGSANQYVKILTVDSDGKPTSFGSDTPSGVELSDSNPVMDGTPSAGSGTKASRNDHVHPSDTNKANKDLDISGGSANQYVKILTVDSDGKPTSFGSDTPSGGVELSDSNPVMDSTASAGIGTKASRNDHVHPSDTSKLGTNGDGSNVTTDFTVASSRSNIATGEKLSVLFGKIAKWFTDLGTAAFRAATSSVTNGSSDLVESGAVFTELNDKTENNEIAIVITGARPAVTVTPGQYVIVRGSTISGVTDGLYTAVNALSPSTDVASTDDLSPVSNGGLNNMMSITQGRYWQNIGMPSTGIYGQIVKCGKVCSLSLIITSSFTVSENVSWYQLLEINSGYRPATAVGPVGVIVDNGTTMVKGYDLGSNGILRFACQQGHTYSGVQLYLTYFTN